MTTSVEDRLDGLWETCDAQRQKRAEARRTPPLVRIWDGDWNHRGVVFGEIDGDFSWKLNDTGTGKLVLPHDHTLGQWCMDPWGRAKKNVHITVDKDGARWGGRLRYASIVKSDSGQRTIELEFLHDYEELKRVLVWSNPFLPSSIQFPRTSILAGPAAWTLKTMLFMNLFRLGGSLWRLPDDPLSLSSWGQGMNMREWPIIVAPGSLAGDSTPWAVVSSRFKFWHDMAETTLADSHLMVTCRRWIDGDPQPWAGYTPRNGQLIVDIVDKSGHWSTDGFGGRGNIFTGIGRTITALAPNLVDEEEPFYVDPSSSSDYKDTYASPEVYRRPGLLSTVPEVPYVVFRDGAVTGVKSAKFTWEPSQAVQIVGGGHSATGVNAGISAAVQLAGNTLGQFVFVPTAGTIADTFLRPIYEDTILAWMAHKSISRPSDQGWSHYYEHFARGSDRAYTLSGLAAMREGMWETQERTSHQLEIQDGAPWFVGENGMGHFFLGDRIAATVEGLPPDALIVEQVTELDLSWGRDHMGWNVTIGDPRSDESAMSRAFRKVSEVVSAVHDLGVI